MKELRATIKTYGTLKTRCVDLGNQPSKLAVFCHGYGAPGTDLVSLATALAGKLGDSAQHWRLLFPEAPLSLAELGIPGGRAWWPINMQQLVDLCAEGRWDLVRNEQPPGIDAARKALTDCIDQALHEFEGIKPKLLLGGFSQGAMLALDTALRGLSQIPDAIVLYSGTLVCEAQWRTAATTRLKDIPVLQSHGRWDPILPFVAAEWLADLLREAGAKLTFYPFNGPHTIPDVALLGTVELMRSLPSVT